MNAKIARLDDRTVLTVTGPEATTFLHNVVTADVAGLSDGDAVYSALLTPQGKVLFDFFIIRQGDGFLIECDAEQSAALIQRLTMYKLRADVTIAAVADISVHAAWDEAPDTDAARYADPREVGMGWRVVGAVATNATAEDYHAHRIDRGIADTMTDIGSGEVFPHEANMDQLGAISFSKGCYIGQEVVSRMQHRGTARTRFVIVSADAALTSGAEVRAAGRRIGRITSVAGHQGLGLLRIDRVANARRDDEAIMTGDIELHVSAPPWATFSLEPQEEAG